MTEARLAIRAAAAEIVDSAIGAEPALAGARLVGIGWATVDLVRAERELGAALGAPLETVSAPRDPSLGATVRVARSFEPGVALVLLEPDTEARLAALLARHAEGVVAAYVRLGRRILRLELTSGRGGPAPRAVAVHPPWAGG